MSPRDETPKRRNAETPKRRNAETPKRQNAETPKRRNVKTPKRQNGVIHYSFIDNILLEKNVLPIICKNIYE